MKRNILPSTHLVWTLIIVLWMTIITLRSYGSEPSVVARGPHHSVWQRVSEHITPYARKYYITNTYQEISTGQNYLKANEWVPSVEQIAILANGFGVSTQLQHKVVFAPNINTAGAVDCLMPDDRRLRSHVLGLAYTDRRTGQAVMIAEVRDSIGVIVGNNQVLYPDAFETEGGFRVDIRYTVTLSGLEQDIILVECPPNPLIYGIQPADCRLEVYSEFVEAAQPTKETVVLTHEEDAQARQGMAEPDLIEEKLIFGAMRMDQGSAFRFGEDDLLIPMGKTWEQREGRQLLIERANYSDIEGELARLPQVAELQNPKKTMPLRRGVERAWAKFLPTQPPRAHAAVRKLRPKEMAQVALPNKGFVLDWQLVNANTNDFTFRGDTTYYVTALVNLTGSNVFEAGTVIKFTNAPLSSSVRLVFKGPLVSLGTDYRPVFLTSMNDNSVGEIIPNSSGNPSTNYAGRRHLEFDYSSFAFDLARIYSRYAREAFFFGVGNRLTLSHSAVGYAERGFGGSFNLASRNVLIHDCVGAMSGGGTNRGEHVTFHRCNNLIGTSGATNYLTNSLIIAVTNTGGWSGANVETSSGDTGIFQSAGWGNRYLASSSPYRNAGNTNINTALLTALRYTTTYPPLVLSNYIAIDTTLTPQAQRDTDTPDLGFHYFPIDWLASGISVTGATLRVSGGAAIAMDSANTNWGIRLESGAQLVSEGDPTYLNRFMRTHSVQEVPAGSGASTAPLFADTYPLPSSPVTLDLRFSDVAQIQKAHGFYQENGHGTFGTLILRDSQFRGGTNFMSQSSSNQFVGITNVLFEQSSFKFYPYPPTTLRICDSTFKGGWLGLLAHAGSDFRVLNNIFDYTTFDIAGTATVTNDYNGYLTNAARLTPNGANDVVLATNTVNFLTGALGAYYLPSTSGFIDLGSVTNAGFVGLWHYTTQTNQTKDAATRLDLGFHYIAVDGNNLAIDSDLDGVFDYLEDVNGDGDLDSGETNYNDANDLGLRVLITRPQDRSIIP